MGLLKSKWLDDCYMQHEYEEWSVTAVAEAYGKDHLKRRRVNVYEGSS